MFIKNGKVYTMEGQVFESANILVENGKIVGIGPELVAPEGVEVFDATGKIVMPGFIDAHCHLGLWEYALGFEGSDGNEATNPITPAVRGLDGINPMDKSFERALTGGVTCVSAGPGSANVIGGQFAILKTMGNSVDQMVIEPTHAMKCAFGENPKRVYNGQSKSPSTRMAIAYELRNQLFKAKEYVEKLKLAEEDPTKKPAFDMNMEALAPVVKGEIPLKAHCHRADDILTAIRIAKEFDVKLTLDHCTEGHLIPEILAEEGYPCIIGPTFGFATKVELKNKSFITPKVLSDAGVKVAIMTDSPVIEQEYLPMCAALAHYNGVDELEALKMITINPAEILGIDDKVGSIKVGKDADLSVWDGHPFDLSSDNELTLVNGQVAYRK